MADARKEEQRRHVVDEIVQTEATFVQDLNVRVLRHLPPRVCIGSRAAGLTIHCFSSLDRAARLARDPFSW